MRTLCRRLPIICRRRTVVVAALLAALLAGTLGIPTLRVVRKNSSQPFPCQDHACGCADAESCWQGCCCFTLAEILAWAERNSVTPPAEFTAVAPADNSAAITGRGVTKHDSCCHKHEAHTMTCDVRDESHKDHATATSANQRSTRFGVVSIEQMRRCRGLSPLWLTIGDALPPSLEQPFEFCRQSVGWGRLSSITAPSIPHAPATPPPRISA